MTVIETNRNSTSDCPIRSSSNSAKTQADIDPLDDFMTGINEQLAQERSKKRQKYSNQTIITSNNASSDHRDRSSAKGELIVSNDEVKIDQNMIVNENDEISTSILSFESKKAKMKAVNHDKIYYASFKKDFYVPSPQSSEMSPDDVEVLRLELDGIRVRGNSYCPPPVTSWIECGLNKVILGTVLNQCKFDKPTPIQSQAIPAMMSGLDVLGIAKTGSGKTLAFVLPALRHILDQPGIIVGVDGPICLVMAPTRELALQITREFRRFTKRLTQKGGGTLRVSCVYGGTSISEQIAELKKNPHIVVCTPGRLIDMLAANNGRVTNLRRCTLVILDEADRMLDFGFEPQVMYIVQNVRPDRQTVMFSATFPREMQTIAKMILTKPVEINVGKQKGVCDDVTLHCVVLEENQKFLKLLELLGQYIDKGSVLVFVEKQEKADSLSKDLIKYHYPSVALHGGVDQYDRDSIISDFRNGSMDLMVATSVAARGLDVTRIILVVNYDCPNHYEDFVHRCGRTGRAKHKGFAYTFVTQDDAAKSLDIIKAMAASKAQVPESLKKVWRTYKEEMESAGKKIRYRSNSTGFSGRGFKFNDDEAQMVLDRKKFQKNILQIQDDSDDECLNIDEQIEQIFASKSRITSIEKTTLGPTSLLLPSGFKKGKAIETGELFEAKKIAERIQSEKEEVAADESTSSGQKTASAVMMSTGGAMPEITKKLLAKKFAEKIEFEKGHSNDPNPNLQNNNNLNKMTTIYETELEINDFPQNVRFKITTKDTLDNIMEFADIFMAVRGVYCPPKKELPENERRLYIFIQTEHEMNIQKAKSELIRIIKEELVRLQNTYVPSSTQNRYKVL